MAHAETGAVANTSKNETLALVWLCLQFNGCISVLASKSALLRGLSADIGRQGCEVEAVVSFHGRLYWLTGRTRRCKHCCEGALALAQEPERSAFAASCIVVLYGTQLISATATLYCVNAALYYKPSRSRKPGRKLSSLSKVWEVKHRLKVDGVESFDVDCCLEPKNIPQASLDLATLACHTAYLYSRSKREKYHALTN